MRGQTVPLAGSYRADPQGARYVGEVDPDERIVVTVYLKRRTPDRYQPGSAGDLARLSHPITRRALSVERRRTHARAANRIRKLAARFGVTLCGFDLSQRIVVLEATAWQMTGILGATLRIYDDGHCRFRARVGSLVVPKEIAPWTRAILGFDQRPIVRPVPRLRPQVGAAPGAGMWPTEVAALYGIPLDHDVSKICVGIIALGGGYLATDLAKALAAMGREPPNIIDQSVATPTTAGGSVSAGGSAPASGNHFGGGSVADEEIALDLQILASLLPKARIVVYFAGNTIQSLVGAINQAIFDDVNRPQVLSVSWGSAEMFWSPSARDAMQAVLADAHRLKVTVLFAAGDELATGGLDDGKAHVWFPSSSPYALGCGGTSLHANQTAITSEVVWNGGANGGASGGGVSSFFPTPGWQMGKKATHRGGVSIALTKRGVPDVAADADPATGYHVRIDGTDTVIGGTSAVAPLWAGLIARINQTAGSPAGYLNPMLYSKPQALRDIISGSNGDFEAAKGWDACTGLGTPNGAALPGAI
jgi:kumamolisin